MSALHLPLIEVIIRHRPFVTLRQRALSGEFLNETTISDILGDPSRTAFLLRMEPGIGPNSRVEIIAAVHDALDSEFGDDWFSYPVGPDADAKPDAADLHERLQDFFDHWPRPDAGDAISEFGAEAGKRAYF